MPRGRFNAYSPPSASATQLLPGFGDLLEIVAQAEAEDEIDRMTPVPAELVIVETLGGRTHRFRAPRRRPRR